MALNFPDNPSLNDTYTDSTSGFTYTWNGTVWISVVDRKIGSIKQVDDISASFDGSESVFDFLCDGDVISPLETNKTIVSLGGVLQNPGDDYSVFGTQITFSTPPTNGLTFFAQVLQTDLSKSTLPNGSIGPDALSTGGFSWNSSGDFIVSGILTSGTSSVTLDGDANQITVGAAGTINESGIDIVGIITAGSYVGDGSNLDGIVGGLGTDGSANTSGIITAISFTGDGRNLTDVGGYLAGLIYNPGIGNTQVATGTGIGITFTKSIVKNTGVINLRTNTIGGTIVESFDVATVGSSSTIAITGATLSITPDTTLGAGTTYFVEVPANTVRDTYDTGGNLGITSFTFVTEAIPVYGTYVVGSNYNGELGVNDRSNRSSPVQLPGTEWKKIHMNPFGHTFGTKTDGTLWAWGHQGTDGNLGLNEQTVNHSSPTQLPGTQWNSVGTRYQGGACTKTDGTLWVWGRNQNGSLGQNSGSHFHLSSPVQVPGTQWDKIVQDGEQANVACTKTDGTLWMMGDASRGCYGLNNPLSQGYSSPRQIPGTQWNTDYVSLSYTGCAGLKTDGTMWQWGANNYGWFGLNDIVQRSSPTQLPGTQWSKLFKGRRETFGIKTDGTLWAVGGYNTYGQLGLNDKVDRSSPVQIPGTQWSDMSSGTYGNLAIKTDGTLWAWGRYYITMQNDEIPRSSPTQIPGTTWDLSVTGEGGFGYAVNKQQ